MNRNITATIAALAVGLLLSGPALAGQQQSSSSGASVNDVQAGANNAGNDQSIVIEGAEAPDVKRNNPGIVAPSLTTTLSETCMGSTSMGFSGAGFGLTFGSTWRDEACVRRLDSREIRSFGAGLPANQAILFHLAAKERMCEDPKIRAAFARVHSMTDNADALCQQTAEEYESNAAASQAAAARGEVTRPEVATATFDEPAQWDNVSDR